MNIPLFFIKLKMYFIFIYIPIILPILTMRLTSKYAAPKIKISFHPCFIIFYQQLLCYTIFMFFLITVSFIILYSITLGRSYDFFWKHNIILHYLSLNLIFYIFDHQQCLRLTPLINIEKLQYAVFLKHWKNVTICWKITYINCRYNYEKTVI